MKNFVKQYTEKKDRSKLIEYLKDWNKSILRSVENNEIGIIDDFNKLCYFGDLVFIAESDYTVKYFKDSNKHDFLKIEYPTKEEIKKFYLYRKLKEL